MHAKIIRTEQEYEDALERVYSLMDAQADTPEADELELLALLVSDYEDRHYPIGPPEVHESIKFHIERLGMKKREVEKLFGSAERAKLVLTGRKPITLALARKLHAVLNMPAELLLQAPQQGRIPTSGRPAANVGKTTAAFSR